MRQGRLEAWQAKIAAPATAVEVARRIGASGGMARPAFAAVAGARPPYAIPNLAVDHAEAEIGIETGLWRGEAHSYTCYFTECFVDELAIAAGLEPLAFRTFLLQNNPRLDPVPRHRRLDRRLGRRRAGQRHGPRLPQRVRLAHRLPGRGRGDRRPAAARQRARWRRWIAGGSSIRSWSSSRSRAASSTASPPRSAGRSTFADGLPAARTIGAYGLPTLRDAPEVTVELIESDEAPGGDHRARRSARRARPSPTLIIR